MDNDETVIKQQISSGDPVVSSPAKQSKNKSKIIIIILAITLLAGLAILAALFLPLFFADDNQTHDEEPAASSTDNDSSDTAKQKPSETKTEQPKHSKAEVKSAFEKYLDHLILADEENNYNREELYSSFFKSSGEYANTETLIKKMHQHSSTYGTVGKEIIESINNDFNTFVRMYYYSDFKDSISKSIRTYYYDFALTHIYDAKEIEQEYLNNNNITAEELVQKNLEQNNTDNKTISSYIKLQYWGIKQDLVITKRTSDSSCKKDLKSYLTCLSGIEGDSEMEQTYSNNFEAVRSMYNIQTSLRSAAVKEIQRLYDIIYAED